MDPLGARVRDVGPRGIEHRATDVIAVVPLKREPLALVDEPKHRPVATAPVVDGPRPALVRFEHVCELLEAQRLRRRVRRANAPRVDPVLGHVAAVERLDALERVADLLILGHRSELGPAAARVERLRAGADVDLVVAGREHDQRTRTDDVARPIAMASRRVGVGIEGAATLAMTPLLASASWRTVRHRSARTRRSARTGSR